MNILTQLSEIEAEAKRLKISIATLCAEADLAVSTYQRWKNDLNQPMLGSYTKFMAAFERLKRGKKGKKK